MFLKKRSFEKQKNWKAFSKKKEKVFKRKEKV